MSEPFNPNPSGGQYPPQPGFPQGQGQGQGPVGPMGTGGPGGPTGPGGPYWQQYPPQPPQKKRNGCLIAALVAVGVFVVLVIAVVAIVAVASKDDKPSVSSSGGASSSAGSSGGSSSGGSGGSGVPFQGKTGKDTAANAGDTITKSKVSITTTPLHVDDSNKYMKQLCTTITVKNDGDKQQFYSMFDWKLQNPNGAAESGMPPIFSDAPGFSGGELAPGGQTSGDLCFDGDPSAMPGEYVLLYQASLFGSDRLAWVNHL